MKLNHHLMGALAAVCTSFPLWAAGDLWTTDFEAAKKEAAASGKSLLIDFTGSDWCGWCIRLDKEVFAEEAFKTAVTDSFVPVVIDFPKDRSKLSEETIAQNERLKEVYAIEGYPTLLLTDAEGRPYATTGYREGGAESYLKHLEELKEVRVTRDEAFAAAEKLEGVAKAKELERGLAVMDLPYEQLVSSYGGVIEDLKASDPDDETGFKKKGEARERFAAFQAAIQERAAAQDMEGALALVDETLQKGGLEPEGEQQVVLTRALIFAEQQKFDESIRILEEAVKIAPDSEIAQRIPELKQHLEKAKQQAGD